MDCSLPGSSVHGISQARILEWVVISSTRGSSQSRYQTLISCTAGRVFINWTTREAWGGTSGKEPLCQCRRHKRRKFDPCIGHNWARNTLKHESLSPCSSLGSRKVWTYFFCSLVPSCLAGPLNLPHQRQWQLRRAGGALSWACQGHPSVLPSPELGIGSQTEDTQSSMWPHLAKEREAHRQNKTRSWKINLPLGFSRKEHWSGLPLEWGSPQPRAQTHISYISCPGKWVLYHKCHFGRGAWQAAVHGGHKRVRHNWACSTLKHESLTPCSSVGSRKVWTSGLSTILTQQDSYQPVTESKGRASGLWRPWLELG